MTILTRIQTSLLKYITRNKTNACGDNEDEILSEPIPAFGDTIEQKESNVTRIAFQNIHGMKTTPEHSEEVQAMDELGIDIFGISEVNLNTTDTAKKLVNTILNQRFGRGNIAIAVQSTDKTGYHPGGTSIITWGPAIERIKKRIEDKMGRFTINALEGKEGSGVLCISIYRVHQTRGSKAGPNTAYSRQCDKMRLKGVQNPDLRNQILKDLTNVIQEYIPQGYHPMVMGDFNDVMNSKEMEKFMEENQLIDIIGDMHEGGPPRTYARGSRRLDYIFGDRHIRDAAERSGQLALHEGYMSDHTMGWADFNTIALFQNTAYQPERSERRQFVLTNKEKKRQFQEKLRDIHKHQQIAKQIKQLEEDFEKAGQANEELETRFAALDREIEESMKASANAVGTIRRPNRSRTKIQYGKRHTLVHTEQN